MNISQLSGCCAVGVAHGFPGGALGTDTRDTITKAFKASSYPGLVAVLVEKDNNGEDYDQTDAIAFLEKSGFVSLGTFTGNSGNELKLLAKGFGAVKLPELPKGGRLRTESSYSDEIEDLVKEDFPNCCAVSVLCEFPEDEPSKQSGKAEDPAAAFDSEPLVLATLSNKQTRAMAHLIDAGWKALGSLKSPSTGNTITLFAQGLAKATPIVAKKAAAAKRSTRTISAKVALKRLAKRAKAARKVKKLRKAA